MNKLIVCGDSYMSPRVDYSGKHFSEIVSKDLGLELIAYSRSGISNGGIALQVLEAVKQNPKLILLNLTFPDRIEFRLDGYDDRIITFKDIDYAIDSTDMSVQENRFGPLASDNLISLLNGSTHYPKDKLNAVRTYFEELYCEDWKKQTDSMMMYAVLHALYKSSVPYIIIQDNLGLRGFTCPIDWIDDKNNVSQQLIPLFNRPKDFDPGFHTSFETQKDIAQFVLNHCDKYFK